MAGMGKPHEERKQEIVEATMELAAEQGVKKVTTQAIADRVGIAQPTVFRHFKNRDAIFGSAIGWVADNLFKALGGLFTADMPADERLHQMILRQLAFMNKQRGIPRVLFSDRLHLESPKLKQAVQQVMDRYVSRVAELIREGQAAGCINPAIDPEQTARYIAATIQGLVMRWSIHDFSFSLEEEGEAVWHFIWPVLAPPGVGVLGSE